MGTIGRLECLLLLLLPTLVHLINAQQYYDHRCPGSASFNSNSTFENNLNQVLASLTANVSLTGFSKAVAGRKPDEVYGLVQCRGNVEVDSCRACASKAASAIGGYCPQKRSAVIWFFQCGLRYSDQNFFGIVDTNFVLPDYCNLSISTPHSFKQSVISLLKILRQLAASSTAMYSASYVGYADAARIYGIAQCTGDLTLSTCNLCLTEAIPAISQCITDTIFSSAMSGSCILWYGSINAFHQNWTSSPSTQQPSLVHPANQTTLHLHSGSRGSSSKIVVIGLSISIPAVLFLCIICTMFFRRRRTTANKEPPNDEDVLQSNEALLFSLDSVRLATDDFSLANKLGEGGFGPVYKASILLRMARRKSSPNTIILVFSGRLW